MKVIDQRWTALILILLLPMCAAGEDAEERSPPAAPSAQEATAALQKAVQNPVASLISVPLQNNSNFEIGPFDRTQNILNIQPVVPIRASENWNVIIRWIAPIIWQPAPGTTNLEVFGIEENTPAYLAAQDVQEKSRCVRFRRHDAHVLLFASQAAQVDLGRRSHVRVAHGYE
jgi:hypothetical protein